MVFFLEVTKNWRCLTVGPLMGYVEDCLMNLKVLKW
jgi:hypothetical protein